MTNPIAQRAAQFKAMRPEMRQADFVASTDTIDSYGDSVTQNWDLERYRGNPVVLYAHDSRALPIGTADAHMSGGHLECTITFASEEANPQAEQVWKLVQERVLRAVSVGFFPHSVKYETRDDVEVCLLDDNELLEISVVPVPANPDALGKMKTRARDAGATTETTNMSKELQDRAEKAEKDVAAALKLAEESAEAHKALQIAHTTLAAELAAEKAAHALSLEKIAAADKAAADALDALLAKEVDDLVGKKILPTERDAQLELARSNRPLFDKLMAQRPEMKILGESVITAEATQENSAAAPVTGDSFAAEVKAAAETKPAVDASNPWG